MQVWPHRLKVLLVIHFAAALASTWLRVYVHPQSPAAVLSAAVLLCTIEFVRDLAWIWTGLDSSPRPRCDCRCLLSRHAASRRPVVFLVEANVNCHVPTWIIRCTHRLCNWQHGNYRADAPLEGPSPTIRR